MIFFLKGLSAGESRYLYPYLRICLEKFVSGGGGCPRVVQHHASVITCLRCGGMGKGEVLVKNVLFISRYVFWSFQYVGFRF